MSNPPIESVLARGVGINSDLVGQVGTLPLRQPVWAHSIADLDMRLAGGDPPRPTLGVLSEYINSRDDLEAFIGSKHASRIGRFKAMVYNAYGNLEGLIPRKRQVFEEYVRGLYGSSVQPGRSLLDSVTNNMGLASAIGAEYSTDSIACKLLEHGLVDWRAPKALRSGRGGGMSRHLSLKMMSAGQTAANGRRRLKENLKSYIDDVGVRTLDDLNMRNGVGKGIADDAGTAENHIKGIGRAVYSLAGQQVNGGKPSPLDAARLCVEHGLLDWRMPSDFSPTNRQTKYLNPEVLRGGEAIEVGRERALANLGFYIKSIIGVESLDGLSQSEKHGVSLRGIASAFGRIDGGQKPDYSPDLVARECISHGIFSAQLPELNYLSTVPGIQSKYLRPEVVGKQQAVSNLKQHVQETYPDIDSLLGMQNDRYAHEGFALKLRQVGLWPRGLPVALDAVRGEIERLGWLEYSTAEIPCFRPYFSHVLPPAFRHSRKGGGSGRSADPEGSDGQRGVTTFVKGEAFEQLVGVFLAYANPDETIIPQFCLCVDNIAGYFGARVDYKAGDGLYEVKWGGAEEKIVESTEKFKGMLTESERQKYHLIRLDKAKGESGTLFMEMLEKHVADDDRTGDGFVRLAALLYRLGQDSHNVRNIGLLHHFRDYMYGLVDECNRLTGDARRVFISASIRKMTVLLPESMQNQELDRHMVAGTRVSFSPLEAHFEYEGKIHRGFISPKTLSNERRELYRMAAKVGEKQAEYQRQLEGAPEYVRTRFRELLPEFINSYSPSKKDDPDGNVRVFLSSDICMDVLSDDVFSPEGGLSPQSTREVTDPKELILDPRVLVRRMIVAGLRKDVSAFRHAAQRLLDLSETPPKDGEHASAWSEARKHRDRIRYIRRESGQFIKALEDIWGVYEKLLRDTTNGVRGEVELVGGIANILGAMASDPRIAKMAAAHRGTNRSAP
ncbi:MAG: hypothetical protein V1875_01060 [Candidatus Altiarchaeota archaeon]